MTKEEIEEKIANDKSDLEGLEGLKSFTEEYQSSILEDAKSGSTSLEKVMDYCNTLNFINKIEEMMDIKNIEITELNNELKVLEAE